MRSKAKIVAVCAGSLMALTGCRHQIETYRQNDISGGELRSPFQSLFAHTSEEHYVRINGRTYRDVRGASPYYLEIPELGSVLFVTGDESKDNVRFHVVSLANGRDTVVDGGHLHFGANIGSAEPFKDSILRASSEQVTLLSQGPKAREAIVLNLLSKKVESVQHQADGP